MRACGIRPQDGIRHFSECAVSAFADAGLRKMLKGLKELERLLDYEVRCSKRCRRCISLVVVTATSTSVNLRALLGHVLRESDELFERPPHGMILMGDTDREGALRAIERYKKAYSAQMDLRFGVASFPEDGETVRELLDAGERSLPLIDHNI